MQRFLPGMGVLNQLLRVEVDLLGAAQQLFADGGNDDLFVVALKDDDAEVFFHFGDTERQGGLRDVALFGGALEVFVAGDREGKLDLAEGNHLLFT